MTDGTPLNVTLGVIVGVLLTEILGVTDGTPLNVTLGVTVGVAERTSDALGVLVTDKVDETITGVVVGVLVTIGVFDGLITGVAEGVGGMPL